MASWVPVLCRSGNRGLRSVRTLTNLTNSSTFKIEARSLNTEVFKALLARNSAPVTLRFSRSLQRHHGDKKDFPEHTSSAKAEESVDPVAAAEDDESFEEHEMTVYRGILSTQIKLVKSFSLMTSVIGLSCQPLLYLKMSQSSGASLAVVAAGGAFLSFFTFATPLLIHYVSKKYVTELLYNKIENTYTAVTYSFLLRRKEITFKASDVKVPDIPGMFTTFQVHPGKVPLFVDGTDFFQPVHYGKLMGYDKPIDFRWRNGHTSSHADALERQEEEKEQRRKDKQQH